MDVTMIERENLSKAVYGATGEGGTCVTPYRRIQGRNGMTQNRS
jgi:hypothetical protein